MNLKWNNAFEKKAVTSDELIEIWTSVNFYQKDNNGNLKIKSPFVLLKIDDEKLKSEDLKLINFDEIQELVDIFAGLKVSKVGKNDLIRISDCEIGIVNFEMNCSFGENSWFRFLENLEKKMIFKIEAENEKN